MSLRLHKGLAWGNSHLIDARAQISYSSCEMPEFHSPGGEGPSPDRRSLESQAEGIVTLILKETPQRVHS